MKKDYWNDGPGEDGALESPIGVMVEHLAIEKAPASLSRRLKRIPREQGRKKNPWSWLNPGQFPRWAMAPAFAAVPLLVLVVVLLQPRQPSPADVEQARQDLANVGGTREVRSLAVGFAEIIQRIEAIEAERTLTQERMVHA